MKKKSPVSLILMGGLILLAPFSIYAQHTKHTGGLALRGRVLKVELTRKDKHYVDGEFKLSLDFVNESNEPVIILQPDATEYAEQDIFWPPDVAVAKTKAAAESGK